HDERWRERSNTMTNQQAGSQSPGSEPPPPPEATTQPEAPQPAAAQPAAAQPAAAQPAAAQQPTGNGAGAMAAPPHQPAMQPPPAARAGIAGGSGSGLLVFAGTMMIVIGAFEALEGLAAVLQDELFIIGRNYAYDLDVSAWGWVHLIAGLVVAVAGVFVL